MLLGWGGVQKRHRGGPSGGTGVVPHSVACTCFSQPSGGASQSIPSPLTWLQRPPPRPGLVASCPPAGRTLAEKAPCPPARPAPAGGERTVEGGGWRRESAGTSGVAPCRASARAPGLAQGSRRTGAALPGSPGGRTSDVGALALVQLAGGRAAHGDGRCRRMLSARLPGPLPRREGLPLPSAPAARSWKPMRRRSEHCN